MPHKPQLITTIENEIPILLHMGFDPGWDIMRSDFEAHPYEFEKSSNLIDLETHERLSLNFHSASTFLNQAAAIYNIDPTAFAHTYVVSGNTAQPIHQFITGKSEYKFVKLKESFNPDEPHISKLNTAERNSFVENKERTKRAASKPKLLLFNPTHKTARLKRNSNNILLGTSIFMAKGTQKEREQIGLYRLHVPNENRQHSALHYSVAHNTCAIITTPYIYPEQINKAHAKAATGNNHTQYPHIAGKVTNRHQVATSELPEFLLTE